MSDSSLDPTTSTASDPKVPPPLPPSKPAWPFAVVAFGLLALLIVFEMGC